MKKKAENIFFDVSFIKFLRMGLGQSKILGRKIFIGLAILRAVRKIKAKTGNNFFLLHFLKR